MEFCLNMNHLIRKRSDLTRALMCILFISVLLAFSVTTAASTITITVTAGSHGTIDQGSVTVNPGDNPSFWITPDPGYDIIVTLDDGVSRNYGTEKYMYQLLNVISNHKLDVTFAPETGSLPVSSNPSGATIFIDNINVGTTGTQLNTATVSVGDHTLRLHLEGYKDITDQISIKKGNNPELHYSLVQQTPTSAPPTSAPPTSAPPTSAPPTSAPPTSAPPTSAPPTSAPPTSAPPTSAPPTSAPPTSAPPTSAPPTSAPPTSNVPGQPSGQTSMELPTRSASNPTPTDNQTNQTNTILVQSTNGTNVSAISAVTVTPTLGTNNSSVTLPFTTYPTETSAIKSVNETPSGFPPVNLPPSNVIIFLFIALIPLILLLVHDYLGLGHLSFPQPLTIRAGVSFGQVVCATGLLFVLSKIIELLPALTKELTFLPLLIVLLFGAYLIFSALALAIGSLLSRPLRWTLKVHVVIGVITLIVTLILLFWYANGNLMSMIMPILVTIIAVPVSALLALWQDHSLASEVHKHRFPFDLFNGEETRITSGSDPYRRSMATRPDIFPPELADRYASIEFLGMGGISHVFRAMRLKDGMTVAVKIPIRFDDTTGKCFLKEILAWEGLRHPNIVEITEANILPIPYVEMEFMKSGLADLKTPLPVKDAAEIVSGVAEGLAYAHEQGIIHRDIKPQNILIDGHGVPKISDWGMSRLVGSSAIQTVAGFSLAYASPEQVSPKRFGETDERTDIYQLGVVFYELVTGKLLFPGDDLAEVSNAIISKLPVPPSEVNPLARPLDPIILKCLQKKPEDRYRSVREMLIDLKQFLGSTHDTRNYDSLFDENEGVE